MPLLSYKLRGTLFTFIVLENLCLHVFFKQGFLTQGKNAILLFLSSIVFGVVFLLGHRGVRTRAHKIIEKRVLPSWVSPVLLVSMMVVVAFPYASFLQSKPLSPQTSDVIPLIQVACRRLLAGEYPYSMVTEFGWPENMTYLPMHWLPICIAQIAYLDPRWVPFCIWVVVAAFYCRRVASSSDYLSQVSVPVLFFVSWLIVFKCNSGIFESTVELMIAAYYMVFVMSLNKDNSWWQGVIVGICLLSRYSLVLWLPLFVFVLFMNRRRKQLAVIASVAASIVILLYVLPFMTRDPRIFIDGYHYYDKAAQFEWTHMNKDGMPVNLFAGTGFAYFVYTRFDGIPIEHRISLLQRLHVFASLGICVLLGAWYARQNKKIDHRAFLMGSFKIYLSVFLFLIQVPYEYLMIVGNFVSVAMFCELLRMRRHPAILPSEASSAA